MSILNLPFRGFRWAAQNAPLGQFDAELGRGAQSFRNLMSAIPNMSDFAISTAGTMDTPRPLSVADEIEDVQRLANWERLQDLIMGIQRRGRLRDAADYAASEVYDMLDQNPRYNQIAQPILDATNAEIALPAMSLSDRALYRELTRPLRSAVAVDRVASTINPLFLPDYITNVNMLAESRQLRGPRSLEAVRDYVTMPASARSLADVMMRNASEGAGPARAYTLEEIIQNASRMNRDIGDLGKDMV